MFERETWFAWFPVMAKTTAGTRLAWLETVLCERFVTNSSASKWRYYITH